VATLWVRHAPSSAAVARRSVAAAFRKAGFSQDEAFDIALIASELVGNAVRHGLPLPSGHIAIEWTFTEDSYRITVTDGGDAAPRISPREAEPEDTCGRGLMIVAALTADWGVERTSAGTSVWASGPLPQAAPLSQEAHHARDGDGSALQSVG